MDDRIREAERNMKANPDDEMAKFEYRNACLRGGQVALAGTEPGDRVTVTEVESPWIKGTWEGILIKRFPQGDAYIRPIIETNDYRVKPSKVYFDNGLYVTHNDIIALKTVATPEEKAEAVKLGEKIK